MSARCAIVVFVTLPCLAFAQTPPAAAPQALFDEAARHFNDEAYVLARLRLEKFLKDHGDSPLAAEAAFKLGSALLLDGQRGEAQAVYQKLLEQWPASPWALLVLHQMDKDQLAKQAEQRRRQAMLTKKPADGKIALRFQQTFVQRHPDEVRAKKEVLFRVAHTHLLAGEEDTWAKLLEILRQQDGDGAWGKLARFWMADPGTFAKIQDELAELTGVEGEQITVFLDLADKFLTRLPADARLTCRMHAARCWWDLGQPDRAVDLFRQVAVEEPTGRHAEEANFWLAERAFHKKELAEAKKGYQQVVRLGGNGPRAALARRWLLWLDELDDSADQLARALRLALGDLVDGRGDLAMTLRWQGPSDQGAVRLALAQGEGLVQAQLGKELLALHFTKERALYLPPGERTVQKIKKFAPWAPALTIRFDADKENLNLAWGLKTEEGAKPQIDIDPRVAEYLVGNWKWSFHIAKTQRVEEGRKLTGYRFETPSWKPAELSVVEVLMDERGKLQQAQLYKETSGKVTFQIALTDLAFGKDVTRKHLTPHLPPDAPVREVDDFNMFAFFGQAMQLIGRLTQQAIK